MSDFFHPRANKRRRRMDLAIRVIILLAVIGAPVLADAQPASADGTPITIAAPVDGQILTLFGDKTATSDGITFHVTGYKGFGQVRMIFETTLSSGKQNIGVSDAISIGGGLWRTRYSDSSGYTTANDPCGIQCNFQNPAGSYPYLTLCGDGYCTGAQAAGAAAALATCYFTLGFGCAVGGAVGTAVAAMGCSSTFKCPQCRLYGVQFSYLRSNPTYDLEDRLDVSCQASDSISVTAIIYNVDVWDHPVEQSEWGTSCGADPSTGSVSHCSVNGWALLPAHHCYAVGGSWAAKDHAYPTGLIEAYSGTTASNGDIDTSEVCLDDTGAAPGEPYHPTTPTGVI
jgi:hypothetical protein